MWLSIVSLLNAIAKGFGSLVQWMRESSFIKQGQQQQQNSNLKEVIEAVKESNEARIEARTRSSTIPTTDSLPDDGFRRD